MCRDQGQGLLYVNFKQILALNFKIEPSFDILVFSGRTQVTEKQYNNRANKIIS